MALSTLSGSGSPLNMSASPALAQLGDLRADVVAVDDRDAQRDARLARPAPASAAAQPRGLMPPALLITLMPLPLDLAQHRLHRDVDEVGGVAALGLLRRAPPPGSPSWSRPGSRTPGSRCRPRLPAAARPTMLSPQKPEAPPMRTILLLLVMEVQLSDAQRAALAPTRCGRSHYAQDLGAPGR